LAAGLADPDRVGARAWVAGEAAMTVRGGRIVMMMMVVVVGWVAGKTVSTTTTPPSSMPLTTAINRSIDQLMNESPRCILILILIPVNAADHRGQIAQGSLQARATQPPMS
jgi:hypothetical protein